METLGSVVHSLRRLEFRFRLVFKCISLRCLIGGFDFSSGCVD